MATARGMRAVCGGNDRVGRTDGGANNVRVENLGPRMTGGRGNTSWTRTSLEGCRVIVPVPDRCTVRPARLGRSFSRFRVEHVCKAAPGHRAPMHTPCHARSEATDSAPIKLPLFSPFPSALADLPPRHDKKKDRLPLLRSSPTKSEKKTKRKQQQQQQ